MPARSLLMSATNTGTPARLKPSAITRKVDVLPVPVAPAISPCRFATERIKSCSAVPLPSGMRPSAIAHASALGLLRPVFVTAFLVSRLLTRMRRELVVIGEHQRRQQKHEVDDHLPEDLPIIV